MTRVMLLNLLMSISLQNMMLLICFFIGLVVGEYNTASPGT